MKIQVFVIVSFISLFIHKYALPNEMLTVRYINEQGNKGNNLWEEYFVSVLALALETTKQSHGDSKLIPIPTPKIIVNRAFYELAHNNLDIFWTMTSIERENNPDYRAIRIPLLKGILGYRIFIIRDGEQVKFNKITDIKQLKQLTAGQGIDWSDTEILRNNDIPIITGATIDKLFNMLKRKRFDYFPRGVMEPWAEIKSRPDDGLTIEKNLAIYYPTAMYFFVRRTNTELYDRIKQGLLNTIENGSFDKLLREHNFGQAIYNYSNIKNRFIFPLENKLSPETKKVLSDQRFVYQLTKEKQ